ncbi:MAG: FAD-binding oxidoreductase [Paracoccaceae bacterium]
MHRSDVIIIGGGIAGGSLAAKLSGRANVVLLEAEDICGYHTTGRSAAMFEKYYGNDVVRTLARNSEAELRAVDVLTPRGVMLIADSADAHLMDAMIAEPDTRRLSIDEACTMVPILRAQNITDVALEMSGCDIDVDLLFQGYLRRARANGAVIVTKAKVQALRHDDDWIATTAQGDFSAPIVVNAAGAWADKIAAMAGVQPLGVQPYRRSMARIAAPMGYDISGWPMLLSASESWYAKPDAGKWLVSAAEEDPVEPMDAWADDMVLAEGLARYQEFVTAPVTRVENSWAGLRSFAPDRTPVVGFDPAARGFFWLAGQGGYGVQTAPAISDLAAALLQNTAVDAGTARALSPERFT